MRKYKLIEKLANQELISTGVIGGSGLTKYHKLVDVKRRIIQTPYGETSSPLTIGSINNKQVAFIARHGHGHTIAPHMVNYRANIWALKKAGVKSIIAVGAVGSINCDYAVGDIVIPDQLIDYSYGRDMTYFDDKDAQGVEHIDFTYPYSPELRQHIIEAAKQIGVSVIETATNAVSQGPRLETAAEIVRMKRDGADVVGMTSMPEAALARELGMQYALINVVVNPAAGCGDTNACLDIEEIKASLQLHMEKVIDVVNATIARVN